MKKILTAFFISLLAFSSCKDEITPLIIDASMEDVNSLWDVSPYREIGRSLDNLAGDSGDSDYSYYTNYYLLFKNDGTGCIYLNSNGSDDRYSKEFRKDFSYTSSDGCHIDILYAGSQKRWTFAKNYSRKTKNGRSFYCDTTIYGQQAYLLYYAEEVRSDSLLYAVCKELRGTDIKVPSQRVWKYTELKGKYQGLYEGVTCDFEFKPDGSFVKSYWREGNVKETGKYSIENVEGDLYRLNVSFSDGSAMSRHIVFAEENKFILYGDSGYKFVFVRR